MRPGITGAALALALSLQLTARADDSSPPGLSDEQVLAAATRLVVERCRGAVVTIDTLGDLEEGFRAPQNEGEAQGGVLAKKGFKQAYGPSSGVVISADGYILTSQFTLQRKPRHIFVTLDDGRQFVAKLVGGDESRGLALLKVDVAEPLPVLEIRPKAEIEAGQFSIAIGRGYGAEGPNVSFGIVSARDRVSGKAIQSSALISPANYGGALVGIDGRLLGIIVPISASGMMAGVDLYDSGIGFAVPASDVVSLLARMKQGEELKPGMLGVKVNRKRTEGGVEIESVERRSPADKAGLKAGDLIISIDGAEVKTYFELFYAIGARVAGDEVVVKVLRDGVVQEVKAVLAPREMIEAPDGEGEPPAELPAEHEHEEDGGHGDGDPEEDE